MKLERNDNGTPETVIIDQVAAKFYRKMKMSGRMMLVRTEYVGTDWACKEEARIMLELQGYRLTS